MKKITLLALISALFLASCTTFGSNSPYHEEQSQPTFQKIENIPEGKCVVYLYRLPAFISSAVVFNARVIEAGEDSFPPRDNKVYGYLKQNGYIPLILEADKLYKIYGGGMFYFRGKAGTEVLLGVKGQKMGFECITGNCEAFITNGSFSSKKQTALITNGEYLESYEAVDNPERLQEIAGTRLASIMRPYIQKP